MRFKYYDRSFDGTVVDLGLFDNNAVFVKKEDGEIIECVAELCEILEKVEDIGKHKNI